MKYFCVLLLVGLIGSGVFGRPSEKDGEKKDSPKKERVCGYEGCPQIKENMINVHMVPHTHDDVGWLKTVDQYYYGSQSMIQKAGVQYIIDSFIQELINDPEKRFIYVESAFFSKWWNNQTPELKEKVKKLVNEGRLEFIGGAWSMNDEAASHYNSIIDHFAWGLKFLKDNFGDCARPKIGWQIDPFGHSREQASIFAQMGYDGLFFGRLDYQDKLHRLETKTMEMIWHASNNLDSDIFTGALHNLYQPPSGFCFDILCADEPMIDDPDSADYNVEKRVDQFFEYVNDQAKYYRTNNIIMTMGGDFTYMDANVYYKNMDKLIKYANERQNNGSKINMFYSTPSCYLKALHDANITWPEKYDDFFPYGSDIHSYWTGYYTSRPTQKHYERIGNHFLQVTKQLTSFARRHEDEFYPHLNSLREIMGVMQHHDAITGTEKQKVAQDYARMMYKGIDAASANAKTVLNQFTTKDTNNSQADPTPFTFSICPQLNVSNCHVTEKLNQFIVTTYNPLAHLVFEYVTIPVVGDKYLVMDYRNVEIKHQIMTVPDTIVGLHFRDSNATHLLTFLAPEIPALGFKSFYITKLTETNDEKSAEKIAEHEKPESIETNEKIVISNKYFNLTFDEQGMLESLTTVKGVTHKLAQNFLYYYGAVGNNVKPVNRSSGAYIFRPRGADHFVATKAQVEVIRGQHVQEVRQIFNSWISQVVRLYYEENYVEFEWMVGPIPIDDGGKEVISRFYSTIENNNTFYTDSNGREMIKRVLNHRETWDLELEETIAGNYYPVTAKIAIEDKHTRMAVLNDRAQGGSSLYNGSIELMVHRRLLRDDAFGVGEALNETEDGKGLIARGKHWLIIGEKNSVSPSLKAQERFLQNQKLLPCWFFFSDVGNLNYTSWMQKYSNIYSAMSLALPKNVHLLTFEPWNQNKLDGHSYLVRFEHILEKNEDKEYSKDVTFNIQDHFRSLDIEWIKETTLAGNQWLEDSKRLKFEPDQDSKPQNKQKRSVDSQNEKKEKTDELDSPSARSTAYDYSITLKPMQIRTFIFKLRPEIYDK